MPRGLILTWDKFPARQATLEELFGTQLTSRGYRVDCLIQADETWEGGSRSAWGYGRNWLAPTVRGTSRLRLITQHLLDLRNDLKAFSILRRGSYDFVLVKDKFASALLALWAARREGAAFVYWLSYPFPESWAFESRVGTSSFPWLDRFRSVIADLLLYRLILPRADHAFVQSDAMRRDICSRGIAADLLSPVPMGFEPSSIPYPYPRSRIDKDPGELWLAHLGTLKRLRDPGFLVRVLARVRGRIPRVRLYFVGSGTVAGDERNLQEEVHRLGLSDSVVITGHLPQDLAWEYVAASDVCLSPYLPIPVLLSTSPTKLVEYLALGRPVVATEHPEQHAVLAESGAGVSVPFDEDAVADAVVELLSDPARSETMGRRGRRWVEEHRSYAALAANVEQHLSRVLASREEG
jgi:glycosyltransferase involved in cell wall biosynthesis